MVDFHLRSFERLAVLTRWGFSGSRLAGISAALVSLQVLTLTVPVSAEGFRSPTIGTSGLGTTGGRIAFVDDASAVFHNPANMMELQRWEVSAEPTIVYHGVDYTEPTGATARTEDRWKLLPHVFVAGPIIDERIALGMAVTVPYGLSVDWGPGGALRYEAARFVELQTFNFNPAVAFRLNESVNIGLGIDVMHSELTLRRYLPLSAITGIPGLPDGDLRLNGSGTGASANAGVTWEFIPRHRLAVTVRAPMDVEYDGDLKTRGIPTGDLAAPFKSRIRFPTIVAVGYGVELTETLRLEANLEWLEFSRFNTLPIGVSPDIRALLQLPTEVRQDWEDTVTVGLGGTWDFADGWWFRASYQYFETPVPEETYSPEIPDATQHAISAGIGYRSGRHRFEAAYSRVFYRDREITQNQNPSYLGRYEAEVHLISAAYGFSF
jgi:long-chain fatty acid transport protein